MDNGVSTARILLIEDHQPDVFLIQEALRSAGINFELTHAKDGQEAQSYLSGEACAVAAPHLILLDLNLPRIHGLDLLKLIRSRPQLADVPVAILTGSRSPEDKDRADQLGANMMITKPTDYFEFVEILGGAAKQLLAARCIR